MGNTTIEWTDATWNPVRGCSRLVEKHLADPLHWKQPKRIFVNSMSDLFHEQLPDEAIDRVFAVMVLCPRHTFQVLTKRPERMLAYCSAHATLGRIVDLVARLSDGIDGCNVSWSHVDDGRSGILLPNVQLGVSVENQPTADQRIPLVLQTPAAVRFVSYEPALGPVAFAPYLQPRWEWLDSDKDRVGIIKPLPRLDWIIVGGESGPGARPFDIAWARHTIAQCKPAGVACFVKQLGADPIMTTDRLGGRVCNPPHSLELRDRKGGNWDEWPADLRVREFPR